MNKNKEKKIFMKNEKLEMKKAGLALIKKLGQRMDRHTQRNLNTSHINYKIHYLLHDPFVMVNAYAKISKNRGALTKGYNDENMMKSFGIEKAKIITNKIKKGIYKFKPVKRTWIPKPGKKKKRPLDVPTQSDRIVQEAVRAILEAIYEPVFEEHAKLTNNLNDNYGFRPNKSCWTAITRIEQLSKLCNIVIEGDIVSAYNNINHDILIKLLSRRIKDKAFLKFIKEMLQSGIMDRKHFEHSLNGTPQGGIVSSLLFNIYTFEFDKYIYEEIMKPILKENEVKSVSNKIRSPEYHKARYAEKKALEQLRTAKNAYKNDPIYKNKVKYEKKNFKKKLAVRLKTPYGVIQNLKKGVLYVRYADDWILALTCTRKEANIIKEKITKFFESNLKMQLDEKKTKISQISKGYKFLGFEIRKSIKNPKTMRIRQKTKKNKFSISTRRTTSRQITVEPDSKRLLKKLKMLEMCDSNYRAKGKGGWLIYTDYQIVQKYSKIMRDIYNYYSGCKRISRLYRISYILQYSCARTLARKRKITMSKIFQRYGKNLRIIEKIQGQKSSETKIVEFTNLVSLRKNNNNKKLAGIEETPMDHDPFHIVEHWRTKFKFYNECCICGSTESIELHHINSLRSIKNKEKDVNKVIRSQINRIQIPVCRCCHEDITHGRYNKPKKPIEFYNEFLAKL